MFPFVSLNNGLENKMHMNVSFCELTRLQYYIF
jgi:hypothetical protein